MSEVKYEPIYGLQKPFDDGPEDATAYGMFWNKILYYKIEKTSVYCFNTDNQWSHVDGAPNVPFSAMRRIIKAPVWTVEDKALGIYPPVGISALLSGIGTCEVIGIDEKHEQVAIKYQDGSFDIVGCAELTPIETPEQLASALRDIWVSRVCEDTCYHHTGDAEVIRSIGMIYDALLSGELKTPEVE